VGVLAYLLPYLEQDNVHKGLVIAQWDIYYGYSLATPTQTNTTPWWNNSANQALAQTRIKGFVCPSDTTYEDLTSAMFVAYSAWSEQRGLPSGVPNAGGYIGSVSTPLWNALGRTNYIGVNGAGEGAAPGWNAYKGILGNRTDYTLGQIAVGDGTSNTLMFTEMLFSPPVGPRPYGCSWIGAGTTTTAYGLGDKSASFLNIFLPASRHAATVQFCWGDGSVRGLRRAMGPYQVPIAAGPNTALTEHMVLLELGGWKDGGNRNTSAFVD
jgi:hypothetical protein